MITTTSSDIKLEAVNAYFGKKHCKTIQTVDDVADSLDGTYFDFNYIEPNKFEEVLGYLYTGTDPAIAGKTGIAFTVNTNDDAATIAAAIKTALDGSSAFVSVSVTGDLVTVENRAPFAITAETDSGSTGFTFATLNAGSGLKLGKTAQGGSTVTLETQVFEVFADQTGQNKLDEVYLGAASGIEMGIIEISKAQKELLIGSATGDIVEGSTSNIVGYGESRLYQSLFNLGGMLVLRPVRLADQSIYTDDVVYHKCAPKPQDINYSGSDQQVMNVPFSPYLDPTINKKVNLVSFGDWTQDEILA